MLSSRQRKSTDMQGQLLSTAVHHSLSFSPLNNVASQFHLTTMQQAQAIPPSKAFLFKASCQAKSQARGLPVSVLMPWDNLAQMLTPLTSIFMEDIACDVADATALRFTSDLLTQRLGRHRHKTSLWIGLLVCCEAWEKVVTGGMLLRYLKLSQKPGIGLQQL